MPVTAPALPRLLQPVQEKEAAEEELQQAQTAAAAKQQELGGRLQESADERAALKEQLKAARSDLSDVRSQLELRDYQAGQQKSREATVAADMAAADARLKERVAELEALKRSLQVGGRRRRGGGGTGRG